MKRICHLGLGRFHRAHQAVYLNDLLQQGHGDDWRLCGIGVRGADQPVLRALRAQDHRYRVCEVDGAGTRETVVASITETIDASEDWAEAIGAIADPATRIVSFTITEAGYVEQPRSAIELATRALAARRDAGAGGVTLMSCDNLIDNGQRLRAAVLACAKRIDAPLAAWIDAELSFPSSMVDRITPAVDADDGVSVICEPWRQWILQDHFVAGRPAWEKVGVVFSDEVKAYEHMKVGLLNGGHSALAHLGLMQGHVRVDAAAADPLIARWLAAYMREVAQVIDAPPGVSLAEYQSSLIQRFANPAVEDRLQRLAQDTSAKFQQALVPPLVSRLQRKLPVECATTAIALWIVYLHRLQYDQQEKAGYQDLRKDALLTRATTAVCTTNSAYFLDFALPLPADCVAAARAGVEKHLRGMKAIGVGEYVARLVEA